MTSSSNHLFTLDIPALRPSSTSKPSGTFICTTHPSNSLIYTLTFESPPDNRLTVPFLRTFSLALSIISSRHPPGLLITTSSISKFYSNGLDLDHVNQIPGFLQTALYPVFRQLLSFPMPTLALLNGHTFAGGALISFHHDYRIMNPSKGYFCLNEIDFGMLIETPLMSAAREKTSPRAFRALVLEGRRFSGPAALEAGIVDAVGATVDEAVKWVGESGKNLWEKGKSGVYGRMREESLRRTVEALQDDTATKVWRERLEREKSKLRKEEEARVKDFEGAKQKAKL